MSNKLSYQLILLISVLSLCTNSNAQLGIPTTPSPVWGSMDTLNQITIDTNVISIDPDPTNNPFLSNGTVRSQDDPGGPGSGGGFGDPPPDAVIPVDGGVGILLLGGAIAAIGRYRKKEEE
jgi:hypothetical protein